MTEERLAEIRTRARERLADAETCRPRPEPEELAEVRQQVEDVIDLMAALGEANRDLTALRGGVQHVLRRAGLTEPSGEDWASRVFNAFGRVEREAAEADRWQFLAQEHHARLEATQAERDRLAFDALCALSAAGVGTPAEGYAKAPECLKGDIGRLVRDRDRLRAALTTLLACLELRSDGRTMERTGAAAEAVAAYRAAVAALEGDEADG